MNAFLVTGAAGFIGFHLCRQLLEDGALVVGLDNLNAYYSPRLKKARLSLLRRYPNFKFWFADIACRSDVEAVFDSAEFDVVFHLAAQAGVRYSLENPHVYAESNLVGFLNMLEECRRRRVGRLIYASSSSVYGANEKQPFSERDAVDQPVSLYAATKRANELMAYTYSRLYGLSACGLRFFTVYGPWGRPDMAIYRFVDAIVHRRPIKVFNRGQMKRDFTYVDDAVSAVIRLADPPRRQTRNGAGRSTAADGQVPHDVFNLGATRPVALESLIDLLEQKLAIEAIREYAPMQPGDVKETFADCSKLQRAIGYSPNTPLERGVAEFVSWYRQHHCAKFLEDGQAARGPLMQTG